MATFFSPTLERCPHRWAQHSLPPYRDATYYPTAPRSISRRIASGRFGISACFRRQSSRMTFNSGRNFTITPTESTFGRPARFLFELFSISAIDAMSTIWHIFDIETRGDATWPKFLSRRSGVALRPTKRPRLRGMNSTASSRSMASPPCVPCFGAKLSSTPALVSRMVACAMST